MKITLIILVIVSWLPRSLKAQQQSDKINLSSLETCLETNYKSLKKVTLTTELTDVTEKATFFKYFYPFDNVVKLTSNNSQSIIELDSLSINKIGYSFNQKQVINAVYISIKHFSRIIELLSKKYGKLSSSSAFGFEVNKTEPLAYNWSTTNLVITLFINRNVSIGNETDNDIIMIRNINPAPF